MNLTALADLRPDSVVDIGANVGGFTMETRPLWPDARYLLIEGNENCRPALESLGERFVIAYLGRESGRTLFFRRKGGGTDTGNSFYRELTPFFADDQIDIEQVQIVTLDEVVSLEVFEFVKIDVQGAELDVMQGGMLTISAAKWVLLEVSLQHYNDGAPLFDEVFSFMESIGFPKRETIGDIVHPITREVVQADVLFSREST